MSNPAINYNARYFIGKHFNPRGSVSLYFFFLHLSFTSTLLEHVCGFLAPRTIHLHLSPCPQEVMFLDFLIKLVWQALITSWTGFRHMGTLFSSKVPHRRLLGQWACKPSALRFLARLEYKIKAE